MMLNSGRLLIKYFLRLEKRGGGQGVEPPVRACKYLYTDIYRIKVRLG